MASLDLASAGGVRCLVLALLATSLAVAGCDPTAPQDASGNGPSLAMTAPELTPTSPGALVAVEFRVTDAQTAAGAPGMVVVFDVVEGGGEVDPDTAITDEEGRALTHWRLGDVVGTHRLAAEALPEEESEDREARTHLTAATGVEALGEADPFALVTTGGFHTCALTSAGVAYCWGGDWHGQLGTSAATTLAQNRPVRLHEAPTFAYIAAGHSHNCGITGEGKALCWGWNHEGQLGTGGTENQYAPTPLAGDPSLSAFALGQDHSCGLSGDGTAYCWGSGEGGRLGTGSEAGETEPTPVAGDLVFTSLAAGSHHTCGLLEDGSAYCWGRNEDFSPPRPRQTLRPGSGAPSAPRPRSARLPPGSSSPPTASAALHGDPPS